MREIEREIEEEGRGGERERRYACALGGSFAVIGNAIKVDMKPVA